MDAASVRDACRRMIANRDSYSTDDAGLGSVMGGAVVLFKWEKHSPSEIPDPLRAVSPECIYIYRDHVVLLLPASQRIYLVGFAEGAAESGGLRLTNGLWLSTGDTPGDLLAARIEQD